jgi:hypothetical protein
MILNFVNFGTVDHSELIEIIKSILTICSAHIYSDVYNAKNYDIIYILHPKRSPDCSSI